MWNVLNYRKTTLLLKKTLFFLLNKAWKRAYEDRRLNSMCLRSLAIAWPSSTNSIDRMILPAWLHKFLEETTLLSHSLGVFSSITHPEASSTQPPPSSAPVWVAEQTPPLRQPCPGSTDPKPRRSPQTPLHLSSLPEMKGVLIVVKRPKYDCGEMILLHWAKIFFFLKFCNILQHQHLPLSICLWPRLLLTGCLCALQLHSSWVLSATACSWHQWHRPLTAKKGTDFLSLVPFSPWQITVRCTLMGVQRMERGTVAYYWL